MTRKEAIEFLKNMIDSESIDFVYPEGDGAVAIWDYQVTALNMAIKALEQSEPNEDAVRAAYKHGKSKGIKKGLGMSRTDQRWIPCDWCAHYPPSSMDGKPCTMCPAVPGRR